MLKLDYTLTSPEERKKLVEEILKENPNPSQNYLEVLSDYLILCMEREERKEKKILTENRLATVGKRETSFEGLVSQLENGEDGVYSLITEDKNVIFRPKVCISKKDLEEIPELKQLRDVIEIWEKKLKETSGKDAFVMKKALIDMRKDQYLVKEAFRRGVKSMKLSRSESVLELEEKISFSEEGDILVEGISLLDSNTVSAILCRYSSLKASVYDKLNSDAWALMQDFDSLCDHALRPWPIYERIVELKVDGVQNTEIQSLIQEEFGIRYSIEYISSLWRNKIPKLISSKAEEEFLDWYFLTQEKGKYKKCSRCGQVKLACNRYFSKNNTSKDGLYSICKECRSKKRKGEF